MSPTMRSASNGSMATDHAVMIRRAPISIDPTADEARRSLNPTTATATDRHADSHGMTTGTMPTS
jgi:hypothetical protein